MQLERNAGRTWRSVKPLDRVFELWLIFDYRVISPELLPEQAQMGRTQVG